MIIRLLLYLVPLVRMSLQEASDCSIRVDVLDGADLVEAVAVYLTDTTNAPNPTRCAVDCHRRQCDVAYFDPNTRKCRFTSETSQSPPLRCTDIYAIETKQGVAELDKVRRYCMKCRSVHVIQVTGDSAISGDWSPLKQVHSNAIDDKTSSVSSMMPSRMTTHSYLPRRPLEYTSVKSEVLSPQTSTTSINSVNHQDPTSPAKIYNISRRLNQRYGNTSEKMGVKQRNPLILRRRSGSRSKLRRPFRHRHYGHRHRKNRRVIGYSFRKSFRPNSYDSDRRARVSAVGRLNTARYLKKKKRGMGKVR